MTDKPAVEVMLVESHQKVKDVRAHGRVATSWQAQYVLEMIKGVNAGWPTGTCDASGFSIVRMPSEEEVVDRCFKIADLAIKGLEERGWTAPIPPADKIITDGVNVGFTRRHNGEADKGGEALPGTGDAAATDSRRVEIRHLPRRQGFSEETA